MNMETNHLKRYNEDFIDLLDKLSELMTKKGEPFRARAYQKAQESILSYPHSIYHVSAIKDLPNVGQTIISKLNEYIETGTLRILEEEKSNPVTMFCDIYGVGPKKAQELVDMGVTTIEELREREDELLNDTQKVGLQYYEVLKERIPRSEIQEFEQIFKSSFNSNEAGSKLEIVGSYRRGAVSSGDIDVIITGKNGSEYNKFVDALVQNRIILRVLSRGPSKTLVIAKLHGSNSKPRRVDFLYTPPNEFAFAILYFTGSKIFNTIMRQHGLNKGYTFNEHGIYKLDNKKKGEQVNRAFTSEQDIFDFLGLEYRAPIDRKDGRSVVVKLAANLVEKLPSSQDEEEEIIITPVPAAKKSKNTLKKKADENAELENIINQFKHNGIQTLNTLTENQLSSIIRYANHKYYNETPILSDNLYDIIKEYFEDKYPSNQVIHEIGAEVIQNKVKLPYFMPSMKKIKPDTNALAKWMEKYKGPYVQSLKLDGVSCMYFTTEDKPELRTRGDGEYGQHISHLIPYLRLPKTKNIVIRGELIIPKNVFEAKYKNKYANPRNMVTGIVGHKHINGAIRDVHFVAYEVIYPTLKPSQQFEFLKTLDVEVVEHYTGITYLSNETLSDELILKRESSVYEIDGLIPADDHIYERTNKNPEHAFAFKTVLSDQIAEAKVVDVIWTPSKDGYLKPRVQIEPIQLCGVTIEYATGFNGAFIKNNMIGIGSVIKLVRSGDVIPHIVSITTFADTPKMPDVPYVWTESQVDIKLENMDDDLVVKEKNIAGFFKGIEVEGLSSGNVSRLMAVGYDSVAKIIKMEKKDFLKVDGFKEKMADKLYNGINDKIRSARLLTIMSCSNIFGHGFSEKKLGAIMNEYPDILVGNYSNSARVKDVENIRGMSTKTAEAFVSKIDAFKSFLLECGLEDKLYELVNYTPVKTNTSHSLSGKSVVLTGTRDKIILEFLERIGAVQGSKVSKNTAVLIAKNKNDDTGKAEDARKLGVPIMTVEEFISTHMK